MTSRAPRRRSQPAGDRVAQPGRAPDRRVARGVRRGDQRLLDQLGDRVDRGADRQVDDAVRVRGGRRLVRLSLSQGKVGRRSETADTATGSLSGTARALVRPVRHGPRTANASAPYGDRGRSGRTGPRRHGCGPLAELLGLRRQRGDEGVVPLDQAQLAGAAGRAELVEELDVRLVVVLPLLRSVVLVEDRLDRADRLTGTTVDAFVRVDVQGPLALVDAVDRALLDARLVLDVDTRLRDDVGHAVVPPR